MKEWVLKIVRAGKQLGAWETELTERIEQTALDCFAPATELTERMFALLDQKRRLANLAVVYRRMRDRAAEDFALLKAYARCGSLERVATWAQVSKSTAARRINTACGKCVRVLENAGYTAETLQAEYSIPTAGNRAFTKRQSAVAGHRAFAPKERPESKTAQEEEALDCVAS